MTYRINGVALTLQPEEGAWKDRNILNLDGNGHPLYPAPRQFEMKWGLMSIAEFDQIYTFFLSQGVTGTSVVDLPRWHSVIYEDFSYTGCILQEPTIDKYNNTYMDGVRLVVTNIRT